MARCLPLRSDENGFSNFEGWSSFAGIMSGPGTHLVPDELSGTPDSTEGDWGTVSNKGHEQDFAYALAGSGTKQASWTFDVDPGRYSVAATWRAWSNRASDAPYSISSGDTPLAISCASSSVSI